MFGLGMGEIMAVGAMVLVVFGANKLPKLGTSFGQAITNFKKGLKDTDSTEESPKISTDSSSEKENGPI